MSTTPARTRPRMDARIRERRRAVVQEQARRRRRLVGSVAVGLLLAGGAIALTYTPLFAVTEVRVAGVSGDRLEAVRSVAGVVPGERLLGVDLGGVASAVESLAWVRTADVTRQPPSTVHIDVAPREPVAVIRAGGEAWLVDRDAVLVGGGADQELVEIVAPNAVLPGVGSPVSDAAVRNALAVHAGLPGPLRAGVVRYEAPSDRGLRALLDGALVADGADPVWARIGTAERVEFKARVLGLLLEQLRDQAARTGGTAAAELDVRAPDNPVIVPR